MQDIQQQEIAVTKIKQLPRSRKPRVLLVDEDLEDLWRYSALLFDEGYQVRAIPSFADGTACVEREDFDLIVVGQGSSVFEGRSVLARAIERNRCAPVLVLARTVEISCYLEAMQSGALDYMEKPLHPSEITFLVRKYARTAAST